MKLIELDLAAQQIKRACSKRTRPFFFIVGAGMSYPPVPLASEIEEHCRTTAKGYGVLDDPGSMSSLDGYSYWFDKAYEQPADRQEYLRELIEGRPISQANFRLAHLLLEKRISNIVVTPNFDDFLSRALTLFGQPHIVCDHPKTVERIIPENDDIQIVHVHGTYWFYDCINLRNEIEDRARSSEQTNATMAFKLNDILTTRSPLVIGYSGWEGDVIMSALKRRLQTDLPYNLYWFCYKRSQADSLPDWVKAHQRVVAVVPPASPVRQTVPELSLQEGSQDNRQKLSIQGKAGSSSDKDEAEPTMPARLVLDKLLRTFELKAPELTSDPLAFFAGYLRSSLPKDDAEKADGDVYYSFASVVERIERARENENFQAYESQLENVRDALRRSQYHEAIQLGIKIQHSDLKQGQLRELMTAIFTAASALNDNSKDELAGYDLVVAIGDVLSGQHADEPVLREQVAKALVNKGIAHSNLNQNEDVIPLCDEVVKRFGEAVEPALRELVARALFNKGIAQSKLKRNDEEMAAYDEVLKRFGEADEPALRESVGKALVNKGYILADLGREEALAICDEVVERFGESTVPALRELVAMALVNKGFCLVNLNRNEDGIAAYDEVVKRFGEAIEPALRELVAKALVNKGMAHSNLKQDDEAISVYDSVFKRFGDSTEPDMRKQVAEALNGDGYLMLLKAKLTWAGGDEPNARLALIKALEKIEAALEYDSKDPIILGNKGYIKFLSGQEDEAREILDQAIKSGGKKIQQIELSDAIINPLPQDEKFRELILSIPLPEDNSGV